MTLIKRDGKWSPEAGNKLVLSGRVRIDVLRFDGTIIEARGWQSNLLLDSGLNKLAEIPLADLFRYCALGTGTTDTKEDLLSSANTFSQTSRTVTRTAGTRNFTSDDVGTLLKFNDTSASEALITAFTDTTHVDVDRINTGITNKKAVIYKVNQTALTTEVGRTGNCSTAPFANYARQGTGGTIGLYVMQRTFVFDPEDGAAEAVTGSYTRSGTTVTRGSGARDFTAADVGSIIHFTTAGVESKITAYTDASHVTVADSGTLAADTIKIYAYSTYTEVGFSDSVDNGLVNIRIKLDAPVLVGFATDLQPGQQLKVTYQLTVAPLPATATALGSVISDPTSAMSGNKTASYVIESFLFSDIQADGDSDVSQPVLDPYFSGSAALSTNLEALTPQVGHQRSAGTYVTALTADPYTTGSFTLTHRGTFGINDAIAANLRTLMLYDASSGNAALTILFAHNQTKDGDHSFLVVFRKTWGRNLNA